MAELYGKVEGCSRGYGGSMHLYDVEHGNLGANAVVGGGLPAITGAALAFQFREQPRVARRLLRRRRDEHRHVPRVAQPRAALEGAGASSSARTTAGPSRRRRASTRRSRTSRSAPSPSACTRSTVDGQDVEAVYAATREALEHARLRPGPGLPERRAPTGSSATTSAIRRSTASKDELSELRETKDPIELLRARLELSDEEFERPRHRDRGDRRGLGRVREGGHRPKPEDALKYVYA